MSQNSQCSYYEYGAVAIFLLAALFFIARHKDVLFSPISAVLSNGGVHEYGFVISSVMPVVLVVATTRLLILFNPQVYGLLFCFLRAKFQCRHLTGFLPYFLLWTALFTCGRLACSLLMHT